MKTRRLLFPLLSIAISGCSVGPSYHAPALKAPKAWSHWPKVLQKDLGPQAQQLAWWQHFQDPVLDHLIRYALEKNLDLKIAESRLRQARAELNKAQSKLFPMLSANGQAQRQRNTLALPIQIPLNPYNSFQAGFDASWEIDFFGGLRSAKTAAQAMAEATEESQKLSIISLLAEVARTYVEFRALQNHLALTKATLNTQEETLELVQKQFKAGERSKLDVIRAHMRLQLTHAQVPAYESQLVQTQYRLEGLLGEPPGTLNTLLTPVREVPSARFTLAAQAPTDILAQRPDIKVAERQLAAATALQKTAIAQIYPKISLAGLFGFVSTKESTLLTSEQKAWSLGGVVSLPIFQFGRLKENIKKAEEDTQQALLQFEKTVLAALGEVEGCFHAFAKGEEHQNALAETVKLSQEMTNLTKKRFEHGMSSVLEVLDVERELYSTQTQWVTSQAETAFSLIALYKSLGGSWPIEESAPPLPATTEQEAKFHRAKI